MKKFYLSFVFFTVFYGFSSVSITRVNPKLFIHQPGLKWDSVQVNDPKLKKELVRDLFDRELLIHEYSKTYDLKASFEVYYKLKQANFMLLDLNKDGQAEVIFQGFIHREEEKEFTEIYALENGKMVQKYRETGTLLAYKINPNTKEIVLFQHQYPCCSSFSHNIYTLRFLNNTFKIKSKYFLANDRDMKGDFFPETAKLDVAYQKLNDKKMVYWSPDKIKEKASVMSQTNEIIHYPKNTLYRVLFTKNNWSYVALYGEPVIEKSFVVNAQNLKEMELFGWIQE